MFTSESEADQVSSAAARPASGPVCVWVAAWKTRRINTSVVWTHPRDWFTSVSNFRQTPQRPTLPNASSPSTENEETNRRWRNEKRTRKAYSNLISEDGQARRIRNHQQIHEDCRPHQMLTPVKSCTLYVSDRSHYSAVLAVSEAFRVHYSKHQVRFDCWSIEDFPHQSLLLQQ